MFGAGGEPVGGSALLDAGTALFRDDGAEADTVGALLTNDRPTVELVFGALMAGARLVSLPLPGRGDDLAEYVSLLRRVCSSYGIAEVVAADEFAGPLEAVGLVVRRHSALRTRPVATGWSGGFTLVQFTSGSTRQPKPVVLTDADLGANVAAILSVVRPRPGDALVSWLPLAHDMGLVGMLLTGVAAGGPGWAGAGEFVLLDPRDFLRRPALWPEALSRWKATFTAAPDFAYRMAAQRPVAAGVDMSGLRCAIVGGEIVRADTLAGFASAFAGHGFDPLAFCPAYGLAELGLAATLTPPEWRWREVVLSSFGLADGDIRPAEGGEAATTLVAGGPALPGYRVTAGGPGRRAGQVVVGGPSIGIDGTTNRCFADADGWYATGDSGFVEDGWLYVCGRIDDYLVAHGRNVYAPAVEAAVGEVHGVRPGRVTAIGLPSGEWAVVAEPSGQEPPRGPQAEALRRAIRRAAVDVAAARPDEVVLVARGALPLTSSGKLQRARVRTRLLKGELVGTGSSVG